MLSSRSLSSGRSEHSRDGSLERKSTSPVYDSKVADSDNEEHSTSKHSSRKKKKRKHHHHHDHWESKSPDSLEHKHSKKEKKKHKSKKKHKRHHAHTETKPSREEHEEELSHQMEDKEAGDSAGNEVEGGGDEAMVGKELEPIESSAAVSEPNFTKDMPNDMLVNDAPTVEQQEDQMTQVLVGVASPDQSVTEE